MTLKDQVTPTNTVNLEGVKNAHPHHPLCEVLSGVELVHIPLVGTLYTELLWGLIFGGWLFFSGLSFSWIRQRSYFKERISSHDICLSFLIPSRFTVFVGVT